jgi:non-ribosomal peptide synthetase component F
MVEDHGVTLWDTVPALMQMLVEHQEAQSQTLPPSLRLVMMSGDWIPVNLPDRIWALGGEGIQVMSLGGATEASIWSILYPIEEVDPSWVSIPYGHPMVNQTFHVLDQALAPRPAWVPGELYIGGIGLAKGYWRDPEKTQASFFTHPHSSQRLYRTGDLGRYLPDGEIEFLGREDFQVKIRGFRIELGEIEAVLVEADAVKQAVVGVVGAGTVDANLVAYVVVEEGFTFNLSEMRSILQTRVPDYMVPNLLIELDAFPLSPNGKVDRKALPEPEVVEQSLEEIYVPPRSPAEETLAAIWAEILGHERIGIHDDFFTLGGHSLLALQVVSRIHKAFGVRIPVRHVFEAPTVGELMERIETTQWVTGSQEEPSEQREEQEEIVI